MRKLLILLLMIGILLFPPIVVSQSSNSTDIEAQIKDLEQKVTDAQSKEKTLSSQVSYMDSQIKLTTLRIEESFAKIEQLTTDIEQLGTKIVTLEQSLDSLSTILIDRVVSTYKMSKIGYFSYLFSSDSIADFLRRNKYLETAQEHDKKVMFEIQQTKATYGEQKDLREEKKQQQEELQKQLETQKNTLTSQKKDKETLLEVTRKDEKRYQELLAAARAELAIVFGGGTETFLREVNEGDTVGTVIPTQSGCSSGQHLHFEVHRNGKIDDPNNYLKSISFTYSYSDTSQYGSINPHGDLRWPLENPVSINQAYGSHSFARQFYASGMHAGIDMDSPDRSVKAIKKGKLYGGAYQCEKSYPGTLLYAKVVHEDGLVTWYLHITPKTN